MDEQCNVCANICESGDQFEDTQESIHFRKVINTYRSYRPHSLRRLARTSEYLSSLPESHRQKLLKYQSHLEDVRNCIEQNATLMKEIIVDVSRMFENIEYPNCEKGDNCRNAVRPTTVDTEKTYSVLKQIVREWSADGINERKICFQPILNEINERFADRVKSEVSILVPGAGLGRLAYDIAVQGYTCQGNEYSLLMLFTSNFILNKCKGTDLFTIYPWIHQYHNNLFAVDQIKAVKFPDADPSAIPAGTNFSMAAGSFIEVYTNKNKWDCVATCFFIDTSHNVLAYVETIWNCLKPGGIWINFGPLLYHFADMPNENSIEPSYDILREAILSFGFEMAKEQTDVRCHYTQNFRAMLSYEYRSVFFVCIKPS
ncbi:UPF0586 protein C9orf41-like protein [Leptotrombidium deliense]|uniref:carnosine N-methyltransferase n=1 Tax=Leptotrombidium deliense TaxID=299467 RepID=A0A443SGQ6_9ACAR|nr:UPF0586 protein C9orf41-like protein [Leptotrombidium deliense]